MAATRNQDSERNASASSPLMVNSVQKAFNIMKAFDPSDPRLTLTQIANKLNIDKSTVQRFVYTLTALGYLDKDPGNKTIGLTAKVLDLSHIYLTTSPLVTKALPYLMHLSQETGETVNLVLLDGTDAFFISRQVGRHLLSTGVGAGSRIPAYCSASGLSILAALSESEVEEILDATDLRPYTPFTIYEPDKIKARLQEIVRTGYAVGVSDFYMNDISIGAPIIDRNGRPIGAVSLAVSTDRYTPAEAEEKLAKSVLATARSMHF